MRRSNRSNSGKSRCGAAMSCSACSTYVENMKDSLDYKMEEKGLNYRQRLLVFHFADQLKEQILAVLPISLLLVFVIGAFFQQTTNNPGQQAYGLVCAIFGLMFFMDGLRVCVMPLGEMVGARLPLKYPLPVVLLVAGALGILVTYAEPAISSLTPLAKLVDKNKAPYLYYALNDQREMLVLSIGLGVGMAAVVGTLRFVRGWSLKPIIYCTLVPTIGLACYMQWGNPDLAPLLGLAWDCGAVTTGPVTVPILLAMGIGVMSSQRQKRLAKAALHNAVDTNTGQTLEGFGVVTLASLFPVLAVELMGIMISLTKTKEDIILYSTDATSNSPVDQSPTREVIFAIRAIMPLIVALVLLVTLVIREPLPPLTVYTVPPNVSGPDDSAHGSINTSVAGSESHRFRHGSTGGGPPLGQSPLGKDSRDVAGCSVPLTTATTGTDGDTVTGDIRGSGSDSADGYAGGDGKQTAGAQAEGAAHTTGELGKPSAAGYQPDLIANMPTPTPPSAAPGADDNRAAAAELPQVKPPVVAAASMDLEDPKGLLRQQRKAQIDVALRRSLERNPTPAQKRKGGGSSEGDVEAPGAVVVMVDGVVARPPWYMRYGGFICGVIMSQGGMIMFNIGLTYGFTALGDQAGTLLPAAFLQVPYQPNSPYYSYVGGIILVMVVAFVLGFLATRAEPALRVLGRTVQHLSGGTFTAAMLIYAVSIGVGSGMAVGSTKILFGVPLIYIILVKYTIAVSITIFSEESFTNIAWDSAGVTTGPVTVPFVLSLGIGFSKATGATEGFGILTAASVAPIISVLLTNMLKKPAKAFLRQLSRLSTRSRQRPPPGYMSRNSLAAMSKRARRHKDTNHALSSVAAIAAAAARLDGHGVDSAASFSTMPSMGGAMSADFDGYQLSPAASGTLPPRDGNPSGTLPTTPSRLSRPVRAGPSTQVSGVAGTSTDTK